MNIISRLRPCFRIELILTILVIVFAALLLLIFGHIDKPRVVVQGTAPDGTEMCIVQQFNRGAEPFTTSFVYKKPGGQWGRFYFDHQDWYWGRGAIQISTDQPMATVLRKGKPVVEFNWETEEYLLIGKYDKKISGAQWVMPASWSPGQPLP